MAKPKAKPKPVKKAPVKKASKTVSEKPYVFVDLVPVPDVAEEKVVDGCTECGRPKAPGQTYVCERHIRT